MLKMTTTRPFVPGKLLQDFHDLMRLVQVQNVDQKECLEALEQVGIAMESVRQRWYESEKRSRQLEDELKVATKENEKLESKLKLARRMNDQSVGLRKKAEEEKLMIELQLQQVRDLLFADNRNKLHNDTKEKLQFLSTTFLSRTSLDQHNGVGDKLSTINEFDSTGSILSDLSFSRSEDDLDPIELRSRRSLKKYRPSIPSDEVVSVKRRRSYTRRTGTSGATGEARPGECLVTTTRVTLGNHGAPVTASSVIETFPSPPTSIVGPQKPTIPSAPPLSENDSPCGFMSPTTSVRTGKKQAGQMTPTGNSFFPLGSNMINTRIHNFTSKAIIRPENCEPCGKKIKFGRSALRCLECRSLCHPECRDQLRLPCIPPGNTPTSKGSSQMVIADYAPPTAPMVPAIVVHCVNEIESRGLNEVGVYRMSGSEKEVKVLKGRFLCGKGVPNLSHVPDIHIISCCLKDFLKSLYEPLATYTLWPKFLRAVENSDVDTRRAELYQTFTELPQPNRDTLAFILLHLQRVAQVPECKMDVYNLARVLGPTIIGSSRPDVDPHNMYKEAHCSSKILEELLLIPDEYWKNFLNTQELRSTPSTQSLRERCGFLDTPLASGRYTVRRK